MSYTLDLFAHNNIARTRFHLYPPIVTGNGYECLSSYLQRCANEHFVSTVSLLEGLSEDYDTSMLTTFKGYTYAGGIQSYRINGRTGLTEWLSRTLVNQKLLIKVNQMMVPKGEHYKGIELRKHLAWCPMCLKEQQDAGLELHYPLLWMPKNYSFCHKHHVPLIEQCPSCNKYQPVMAFHNHPGRCAHCFSPLSEKPSSYPYGYQEEMWRINLNNELRQLVSRRRYSAYHQD